MLDPCVPVVLLRIDPNPFHHGTLGAARSMGRCGVEVHVVAEADRSPVARSRYVHRMHHPPPHGASPTEVDTALRRLAARIARPAVLIPMDDAGAIAVSRLRGTLTDTFLLPDQPPHLAEHVADKARLPELCRSVGIEHPATVLPQDEREACAAVAELGLPVVAKWSRPWLLPQGSGLRSTCLVTSAEQARDLYRRGRATGSGLLLQKYLAAGRDSDWFFHGYADRFGRLHGGGAGSKRHSFPRGAGLTAVGRWTPVPELQAMVERLVEAVGYRGIFDIDFRVDGVSGKYCLLDFNPRPGAQFRLFADGNGLDVVRAQYLDLTYQAVPAPRPLPGRTFVVENYAPLSALRALLTPAVPAQRAPTTTEFAWHAPDDPAPARGMAAEWSRHVARRLLHRARPTAGDAPPQHPEPLPTPGPPPPIEKRAADV
ncbi:ATP-grasp domain-containing protein [Streptomyces sp. SID14478]|uniref:carboxylate--amine ligase n=1 Tax=Streptomyces sp. SID14478 TaxID=2706073 RepID=UPI001940B1D5|nr:ATP-grasp domain-containing protein [Streptomyces sp. SID14478]